MINAVIYSRVSSESERQDTERQTNELIDYAHRMGYTIVDVFEEKVSGFKKNEQYYLSSHQNVGRHIRSKI